MVPASTGPRRQAQPYPLGNPSGNVWLGSSLGACAQGSVTGERCIVRALWHREVRCSRSERGWPGPQSRASPQRARCFCQPPTQSACHSTLAARPHSRTTDNVVLCSQILGKFRWLSEQVPLAPGRWICSLVHPLLGRWCRPYHPNAATCE